MAFVGSSPITHFLRLWSALALLQRRFAHYLTEAYSAFGQEAIDSHEMK